MLSYDVRANLSLDIKVDVLTSSSCLCGAQFCYVCGLRWKTCTCPQWDDARLLARATQVVRRVRPDERPHNAQAEQHQIQRAVQNLRERHECNHQRWQYVRGPNRCEECHHTLSEYIFECGQCQLRACNRCRRNRL